MADVSCATCRWWEPWYGEVSPKGECRRNPPKVTAPDDNDGVWPTTNNDSWCGEHAPKSEVRS